MSLSFAFENIPQRRAALRLTRTYQHDRRHHSIADRIRTIDVEKLAPPILYGLFVFRNFFPSPFVFFWGWKNLTDGNLSGDDNFERIETSALMLKK